MWYWYGSSSLSVVIDTVALWFFSPCSDVFTAVALDISENTPMYVDTHSLLSLRRLDT